MADAAVAPEAGERKVERELHAADHESSVGVVEPDAPAEPPDALAHAGIDIGADRVRSSDSRGPEPQGRAAAFPVRSAPITMPPDEELWIIERAGATSPHFFVEDDEVPGSGALVARLTGSERDVPVPLERTDVKAAVSGYVASVAVTQKFHNPFDEKIEAVYVFPLPQNAAVNEFVMRVGERRIRGIIRERSEAETLYRAARSQGKVASLMTQERPNIFTQKVANIEPGKRIDIDITYFSTLRWVEGSYELVFPMVVGPRFNPPHTRDGVAAVTRLASHGSSGRATEVSYLRPEERSGHDIAIEVAIDAGVPIERIESPTHAIAERGSDDATRRTVVLSPNDRIPNRDFVLRWAVAGARVKTGLVTHRDARGGFLSLMLFPPAELRAGDRQPMELVFVLDCSGSMKGEPLAKAKHAVERAIKRLNEEDTFQIIRFSRSATGFAPRPVIATPRNVRDGLAYLHGLEATGGTMMIHGIRAALDFPRDPLRQRVISFMTDGYIGNEDDIFAAIQERVGDARIFSFGVGSSVNRHLMEGMARLGRGAVAYVGLDESTAPAVDTFYDRISHPALTDVEIDWGELDVRAVYPRRVPDLFVGRPVVLTGRFDGLVPATITVRGKAGGKEVAYTLEVDPRERAGEHPGIASVWARTQIAVLADEALRQPPSEREESVQAIRQVALEYSLLSAYTAFVAVDTLSQTSGEHGTTVPVPVPVPAGVRYDTTVR